MDHEYSTIKLLLVRHGETKDNKSKIIQGHQPGVLTELGCQQAKMIGLYFNKNKTPFDFIYVSDLGRTKQTFSNASSKAPHLKKIQTVMTPLIREKGGGVFQGRPLGLWSQHAKKEGKGIREYKCEGGQSWEDVMARGEKFLEMIVREHAIKTKPKGEFKILGVTHGGFIMEFHNVCSKIHGQPAQLNNSAKNCSMHEFEILYPRDQEEFILEEVKIRVLRENFVEHLTP